jgi:ribokinase
VKDIVRPGETISSDNPEKRAGGKGANQAMAVARAGGVVDLVAAVGKDGEWVRDQLKDSGVGVDAVSIVSKVRSRIFSLFSH